MSSNHHIKCWHGIPRDEILWQPLVQSCLCDGCGLCVTTCPTQALSFDYALNLPFVEPLRCLVGCSTCATICPTHAILLPDPGSLHKIIEQSRLEEVARQELRLRRRRYNGKLPETFASNDLADRKN